MAKFYSWDANNFSEYNIDANWFVRWLYAVFPEDNVNYQYYGVTYPDALTFNGWDGVVDRGVSLLGTNITYNSFGDVVGGTINAIYDFYWGGTDRWFLQGISIPAVALYNAFLTTSNSDEIQLWRSALSGNDEFLLSDFNDVAYGYGGSDLMYGNIGNDTLFGGFGADRLFGGAGYDTLVGGAGRDILTGGSASDAFVFKTVAEIGNGLGTRDIVRDFNTVQDIIDLIGIDANTAVAGNQAFVLRAVEGVGFTGVKGQLIWDKQDALGTANDRTLVLGDVNGDRIVDFQLELTGLINLDKFDFAL